MKVPSRTLQALSLAGLSFAVLAALEAKAADPKPSKPNVDQATPTPRPSATPAPTKPDPCPFCGMG